MHIFYVVVLKHKEMHIKHNTNMKGGHLRSGKNQFPYYMYGQYAEYTTNSRLKKIAALFKNLNSVTQETKIEIPYSKLVIPSRLFKETILVNEDELLTLSVMDLLVRYIYPSVNGYAKANIIFIMNKENEVEIIKPLQKNSIPLTMDNSTLIPKFDITNHVNNLIQQLLESYDGFIVKEIIIRVYFEDNIRQPIPIISYKSRLDGIYECLNSKTNSKKIDVKNLKPKSLRSTNRVYSTHITRLKKSEKTTLSPFMVADIETILIDNIHVPYAIGVMKVYPGEKLMLDNIDTYFSEDYNSEMFPKFEDRSDQLLFNFINRIKTITRRNRKYKMNIISFHNLSRFDGFFLLKHLALHYKNLKINPLIRNHMIYEIAVYSGKRLLFRFRDSLLLLPGSLNSLAKNLCPELGCKGSISFDEVRLETLNDMKDSLINYMKQDILLLGGIMLKFQELYSNSYQADIVKKLTIPSLALSLFRSNYYDEKLHSIHIPTPNEDSFIRRGYYGGHTDAYLPYGTDLYYYDVNSLYPYIMKEYPMPGGKPVWHSDLENKDLDQIFGFIEAYIECPESIKRPFLPYRDPKNKTLIFPTGTFIGVYYSEELKFAREIGYTIIPLNGYLFEKMESPFIGYVNDLFESRSKAKKEGNNAISFVYKLLMNSLYGRFGINPESTKTEICDQSRRNILFRKDSFISEIYIKEDLYMVTYLYKAVGGEGFTSYNPPKMAAVQIAAAITASARIYMYPFISREDCYYTDTDSIVLGNPLPEEVVSEKELGKFKLEDKIEKGFFLAPKCYNYTTDSSLEDVSKYKGAGKKLITSKWYEEQYLDPTRTQTLSVTSLFRTDWNSLDIRKNVSTHTLRIVNNNKRVNLIENGRWVGSDPINIYDLHSLNKIGRDIISNFKRQKQILENEKKKMSQITIKSEDDSKKNPHTDEDKVNDLERKGKRGSQFSDSKSDSDTKPSDTDTKPSDTDPP